MDEQTTGALRKEQNEMDTRDFNAEYVEGEITDEMLANLPTKIDLLAELEETYKQGSIPCCTATALCHVVLIQNLFDHKSNQIFVDQKNQRTNNQWKERKAWVGGDYLEHALKTARKNGIAGNLADWSNFRFKIDWYMYEAVDKDFQRFLKVIAYNLNNKVPMYRSMRGNAELSGDMSSWNITTVVKLEDCTRGHAIMLWKIDFERKVVGFWNSRWHNTKNNQWEKQLSVFEVWFDVFEQLCKNSIFNRRYWKVFDFKDIQVEKLFVDFAVTDENSEQYKAVKRAKEKGYIKGVPSDGGARLYPDKPMTRLEAILFLHRILAWQ